MAVTRTASNNQQPRNSITDVEGLSVGNDEDPHLKSGVTVLRCHQPTTASCHIQGAAPGTRETQLLAPEFVVDGIHAVCLSGGSAFGLDSASGVQAALREDGLGIHIQDHCIPIVPSAVIFDLVNGGKKDWGVYPPYREMGYRATRRASLEFDIGSAGVGVGATTAGLKGGLGTASQKLSNGITVGALVVVNSVGAVHLKDSGHFWASPFERGNEFGGLSPPNRFPTSTEAGTQTAVVETKFDYLPITPSSTPQSTTLGIIATDAILSKSSAKRLAVAAHDGFARSIWPAHTPFDGDIVFALSTGTSNLALDMTEMTEMVSAATSTIARAIARGVYEATAESGDLLKPWKECYDAGTSSTITTNEQESSNEHTAT